MYARCLTSDESLHYSTIEIQDLLYDTMVHLQGHLPTAYIAGLLDGNSEPAVSISQPCPAGGAFVQWTA